MLGLPVWGFHSRQNTQHSGTDWLKHWQELMGDEPSRFEVIEKRPVPVFVGCICLLCAILWWHNSACADAAIKSVTLVHAQLEEPATNVSWRYWLWQGHEGHLCKISL